MNLRIPCMAAALALPAPALAFCGTYVGAPGTSLINRSSEVVIARYEDVTTLSLVMDYQGDAEDFALLLPVPQVLDARDVRSIDRGLLDWLSDYSTPRLVSYTCEQVFAEARSYGVGCGSMFGCMSDAGYGWADSADTGVTVANAFREYGYVFVVLDARDSDGLVDWLDANGFAVPEGGLAVLQEYLDAGSYFLAAKIDLEVVERRDGWLPPIQLTYRSATFGLPIRIGTISAEEEQEVVMYVLTDPYTDGEVGISNYPELAIEDECMPDPETSADFQGWYNARIAEQTAAHGAGWVKEYSWDLVPEEGTGYKCDPCTAQPAAPTPDGSFTAFGLPSDAAHLTRLRMRYRPEQAIADLTLYTSGRTGAEEQIRFVDYVHEMEFAFPVCGAGFPSEPGTCPDPPPDGGSFPWTASAASILGGFALWRRRRA